MSVGSLPHPSDSLYCFQMLSWSVSVRSHSNSQLHVLFQFHRFGHNPFKAQILSHRGLKRSLQSTLLGILHGCGVGHAILCSCHLCDVPLPPPQLGLHSSFASIAESQIHMAFLASAQLQQCNGVTFGDVLLLTFYFMGCIAGDNSMNAPMLRGIPICKK